MRQTLAPASPPAPTLRWIYALREQRLLCEISLDNTERIYELRTCHLVPLSTPRVERFGDVTHAFLLQAQLEGRLIAEGWALEFYECRRQPLH
jgi:hypothetical protein